MNTMKNLCYKAFFIFACMNIFTQYTYSADFLKPQRKRMPSPTPSHKPWHELNNEVFINIEDPNTLVKISYDKKQGPHCGGNYYTSGRTLSLNLFSGLKNFLVERKSDQSSHIKFTCDRSREEYVLSAQNGETFIVNPIQNDQIVIEKEGHGKVALFTLQPIKQREYKLNNYPHFELIIDENGNRKIVKKEN